MTAGSDKAALEPTGFPWARASEITSRTRELAVCVGWVGLPSLGLFLICWSTGGLLEDTAGVFRRAFGLCLFICVVGLPASCAVRTFAARRAGNSGRGA